MKPLNSVLYRTLVNIFNPRGGVKVANQGVKATVTHTTRNNLPLCKVGTGESYCICCPKCGDSRYRLWISHLCGTWDKETGTQLTHLLHCFNCEGDFTDFYQDDIISHMSKISRQLCGTSEDIELPPPTPVELPAGMHTLDELGKDHPAVKYLASRNFNSAVLGESWCLGYCPKPINYTARNRIIIPMFVDSELLGWQARTITDARPKYYSARGMQRNNILYNYDWAREFEVGILCEGPLDALRLGPPGMAMLGKTLSEPQVKLLSEGFKYKHLVVMTDSDAPGVEANKKIMSRLTSASFAKVASIKLPQGKKDAAECDFDEIWKLINHTLKAEFNISAIDPKIRTDLHG